MFGRGFRSFKPRLGMSRSFVGVLRWEGPSRLLKLTEDSAVREDASVLATPSIDIPLVPVCRGGVGCHRGLPGLEVTEDEGDGVGALGGAIFQVPPPCRHRGGESAWGGGGGKSGLGRGWGWASRCQS